MPNGNATEAQRIAAPLGWPMLPAGADPLFRASFEIGTAMYRHWLGATSRLLQNQSAHLQNLAECDTPFDILVYQTEFAEKSITAGFDELRRGVHTITGFACEQPVVD